MADLAEPLEPGTDSNVKTALTIIHEKILALLDTATTDVIQISAFLNTLEQDQLQSLHQILIYQQQSHTTDQHHRSQVSNEHLTYVFNLRNHYLNERIANSLFDQRVLIFMAIIFVIRQILVWILGQIFIFYVYTLGMCSIFVIWCLMILLSLDKECMTKVLSSFDFWIKSGYAVMYGIANFIKEFQGDHTDDYLENIIGDIENVMWSITVILLIVIIGSMDAIPSQRLSPQSKAIGSVLFALYFSFWAIQFQFFVPEEEDVRITIDGTHSVFSMNSLRTNAYRIIALFLWKQGFNAMKRRGRCISIRYSPFIEYQDINLEDAGSKNAENPSFGMAICAENDINSLGNV